MEEGVFVNRQSRSVKLATAALISVWVTMLLIGVFGGSCGLMLILGVLPEQLRIVRCCGGKLGHINYRSLNSFG